MEAGGQPRVLITGATGCLGREVVKVFLDHRWLVESPSRACMDITSAVNTLEVIRDFKPDMVINCTAYTKVDDSENIDSKAFAVNHQGAAHVAEACASIGARMIHVSTDMVFGAKPIPRDGWTVLDEPCPVNRYGESKLAGEREVQKILKDMAVIVRTSWLLGECGWLEWAVRQAVYENQVEWPIPRRIGRPTLASDLAGALWYFASHQWLEGVYHWCNRGVVSRAELFHAVYCAANQGTIGLFRPTMPLGLQQAPRAEDCTLNTYRYESLRTIPHWGWGLHPLVQKVKAQVEAHAPV